MTSLTKPPKQRPPLDQWAFQQSSRWLAAFKYMRKSSTLNFQSCAKRQSLHLAHDALISSLKLCPDLERVDSGPGR